MPVKLWKVEVIRCKWDFEQLRQDIIGIVAHKVAPTERGETSLTLATRDSEGIGTLATALIRQQVVCLWIYTSSVGCSFAFYVSVTEIFNSKWAQVAEHFICMTERVPHFGCIVASRSSVFSADFVRWELLPLRLFALAPAAWFCSGRFERFGHRINRFRSPSHDYFRVTDIKSISEWLVSLGSHADMCHRRSPQCEHKC